MFMTQPVQYDQVAEEDRDIPDAPAAAGPDAGAHSSIPAVADLLRELLAWTEEIRDEIGDLKVALGSGKALPAALTPTLPTHAASSPAAKHAAYRQMIARLKSLVASAVPKGATVAVISKGDDELLALDGVRAWHFPRCDSGVYAGHHPADSDAALAHLEDVRNKGAEFLIIPETSLWWLDHFPKFREHLTSSGRQIVRQEDTGAIFQIREHSTAAPRELDGGAYGRLCTQLRDFITGIVPKKSRIAVISKGDPELIDLPGLEAEHFPQQEDGLYSGHHPADSDEALAHLAAFRANGGGYLLIPKPALWWLDFYAGFRDCLETEGRLISRQKHLGVLFFLTAHD